MDSKMGEQRARSKGGKRKRWLLGLFLVLLILAALQLVRHVFQEEEKRARTYFRELAAELFPEEADEIKNAFGLKPYLADTDVSIPVNSNQSHVILIHGLDDPGEVWNNLAPRLAG